MFGQYGIAEKGSTPWAESYIVDVSTNTYAPKGTKQFSGSQQVDPGATGIGALLNVVADLQAQKKQYRIDHLLTGRLVYVLVDGGQAVDTLEFRDFQSGRSYKVALTQSASTKGNTVSSSFSIAITITEKDGKSKFLIAGSPGFKRAGVKAYHIKQIVLAPDGSSLVLVVQREQQDSHGNNIRYMVEVARVK